MNELEIHDAALAITDLEARRKYLDEACRGDSAVRGKVEAMLAVNELGPDPWPPRPISPGPWSNPDGRTFGRNRVVGHLGKGAFGDVWRAYDDELQRPVAIKVPNADRLASPGAADEFLREARTAAGLTHEHLVSVYDVGRDDDGRVYVVCQFIDGPTLRDRLERGRPSTEETARTVATVARALHHAHTNGAGIIHRDVKPENILVDEASGDPYLADFGISISQARSLADTQVTGTPAYMSPEQVSGERVDPRSDVFSLGVVLYEMLTGAKAFGGASTVEILEKVALARPVPPRDRDPSIPAELERICLIALAKAKADRYQSAMRFADDLEAWLADGARATAAEPEVPVVPKGLRGFDGDDARFFLSLLPGPRGRDGLPESVRFWKTRLEETDPEKTFSIGMLYGPSGCGKSSLVKAGLVPRLGAAVRAIVLEASADDTEARLLKALRRAVPGLPADAGMLATFAKVRELATGKIVVILDQFEQWLQAHPGPAGEVLVAALRQCDGAKLQAVVLVRADFGLAGCRFMQAVETPIGEGINFAKIDAFPIDHARDVLVRFGQGLGRLPRLTKSFSAEENAFVDEAIAGLAGDKGRVVPVQLALFADLVKTRPWAPATLASLGDHAGGSRRLLDRIGVAFLEDSFDSRSANPAHRVHAAAARLVLEALLPETSTATKGRLAAETGAVSGIKGGNRPVGELRAAGARAEGRGDFDTLLRILDGELRLITPTDPPGGDSSEGSRAPRRETYYQLTHDYLVGALRDWLTAGRRVTPKGRAELVLAERTAYWSERREELQQLPGLLEWLRIRRFTRPADWRESEKRLMARAARLHGRRGIAAAALTAAILAGGVIVRSRAVESQRRIAAEGAVNTILNADMGSVEEAIEKLTPHASRALPDLRVVMAGSNDTIQKLKAALAVVRLEGTSSGVDGDEASAFLADRLLSAEPGAVEPIVKALALRGGRLSDRFAAAAADPAAGPRRLRAAAALAAISPDHESWKALAPTIAVDLVNVPAVYLATWIDAFRGVRAKIIPVLEKIVAAAARSDVERSLATDILADYAADDPAKLAKLLMSVDPKHFASLAGRVDEQAVAVIPILEAEIEKRIPEEISSAESEREELGVRKAKAGAVLARLGKRERVWPLFIHAPDPRVRSYLIHYLGPFGADPGAVAQRLNEEPDVSAKRALVLALGEMMGKSNAGEGMFGGLLATLVPVLRELFENDPDPGLHSAAEWTLEQFGDSEWLTDRVAKWRDEAAALGTDTSRRVDDFGAHLASDVPNAPRWYVNGQGQTLVVVKGPSEVRIGSPEDEKDRSVDEGLHIRRIGRSFAIGSKPVTLLEYERLSGGGQVCQCCRRRHWSAFHATGRPTGRGVELVPGGGVLQCPQQGGRTSGERLGV